MVNIESTNSKFSLRDILLIAISLILLIYYFYWSDAFDIIKSIEITNLGFLILAIFLDLILQLNMAFRFGFILKQKNPKFSYIENTFRHLILPILARLTPGQLGSAFKLTVKNKELDFALMLHLFERIMDFALILITSSLIIIVISDDFVIYSLLLILIEFILILIILLNLEKIVNRLPIKYKLPQKWFKEKLSNLSSSQLAKFILLSISAWILTISTFYSLANSISLTINPLIFSVIIAFTFAVSSLSGLPGGFGAREFTVTFFLLRFNESKDIAVIYTLLMTSFILLNEIIYFIIGFIGLKIYEIRRKDISPIN